MTLISAAREHEIEFIYAISPGLDITFSNPKEVSTLKRKLDQVSVKNLPQLQCFLIWKLQYPAHSCSFSLASLMFSTLALVWMTLSNSSRCIDCILKATLGSLSSEYFRTLKQRCVSKAGTLIHSEHLWRQTWQTSFLFFKLTPSLSKSCSRVSFFPAVCSVRSALDYSGWTGLHVFRGLIFERSRGVGQG